MRPLSQALSFVCLAALGACVDGGDAPDPPKKPPFQGKANFFNDVTAFAGLQLPHAQLTITGNGVGAACGDYDGDGFVDILVMRDRNLPALLFRNKGDGTFEEVSAAAGLVITGNACGPCFADIDGDGHLDLLVCGVQEARPRLFHNQGDGTFEDITAQSKIVVSGDSCGSAFGDYDRDGDLDVFITRWDRFNQTRQPDQYLWRNNGDLTFTDVSDASQISKTVRVNAHGDVTFTPNFADINDDGWPDLLLVADFKSSRIFINKKDGTFEDTTTKVINEDNGMGGAVGDYDNDGDLDWFVTSISPRRSRDPLGLGNGDPIKGWTGNRLYRNKGDGTFEDATDEARVREGGWGWACSFADFNHDGHLDIAHVNGWPGYGFENDAAKLFLANGDGTFTESARKFGFIDHGQGRGMMCFDYDNDGDLDIFVENMDQPWRLFRNDLDRGNYLNVRLRGPSPNSEGVGARVYVKAGGKTQMREIRCGSNYISQDPTSAHFGIGSATQIDELIVLWPDGTMTTETDVAANQRLVISK